MIPWYKYTIQWYLDGQKKHDRFISGSILTSCILTSSMSHLHVCIWPNFTLTKLRSWSFQGVGFRLRPMGNSTLGFFSGDDSSGKFDHWLCGASCKRGGDPYGIFSGVLASGVHQGDLGSWWGTSFWLSLDLGTSQVYIVTTKQMISVRNHFEDVWKDVVLKIGVVFCWWKNGWIMENQVQHEPIEAIYIHRMVNCIIFHCGALFGSIHHIPRHPFEFVREIVALFWRSRKLEGIVLRQSHPNWQFSMLVSSLRDLSE